jgi:hypothetical protein
MDTIEGQLTADAAAAKYIYAARAVRDFFCGWL